MPLISSIGQHFTFHIIDDILGIMSIKIFKIQQFNKKGLKNYFCKKIIGGSSLKNDARQSVIFFKNFCQIS